MVSLWSCLRTTSKSSSSNNMPKVKTVSIKTIVTIIKFSKHRDLFADQPNLVLFSLVPDDMIALLKKLPLANEIKIENKLSLREKQRAKRKAQKQEEEDF